MSSEMNLDSNTQPSPSSGSATPGQSANGPPQATDSEEREAPSFRYYRPPGSHTSTLKELPDSYFTPSTAELKAVQSSLVARTQALNNAPLRTRAMRDAEDKTRRARYPTTTIRIRFSDRSQLEKTFPSTNKIRSVYAFVRETLREDVKPVKFVLSDLTPPKRELKVSDSGVRDLSLFDLHLAPSSILHISFLDESLNHSSVSAPLNPSVLAIAEDLPVPPDPDSEPSSGIQTPKKKASSSSTIGKTELKVPKWLKLGPKK